jgi:GDPmannose 4,6-dehydratase
MKAIIFGITGQDGSHLADLLLSKDYHVVGVSRRASTDNTQRIKHILENERFELVQGDITDAYSVINILKKHEDVDEIYNLAAQSHVAVSFKQPALTWDITGKGCLNILQSIVDLGINARFYQASSSEMFGKNFDERLVPKTPEELKGVCSDPPQMNREKYQDENTKLMPQSPYAIAKCAAHHMTRLFREAYGLHASAGILFNHEGERRGDTFVTRKITKWIGELVQFKKNIKLEFAIKDVTSDEDNIVFRSTEDNKELATFPKLRLGNLEAFRDWGYAGDYVEAMWMMLQQKSPQDYVICTGTTHTIREFLDVAFSHIGIEDWSDLVVQDPEFYRPAEVDYLRGDCSKANNVLGWTPKHSFEDLVKKMVEHDVL